jgi:ribulose-phosphate 3-epimerase
MEFERSVSPSLLAADYGNLGDAAIQAESGGAGSLHLDYMDGHYVPNISFGLSLIPALKRRVTIPLIAHLMISNTEERLDDFIRELPVCIVLQADAVKDPQVLMKRIREAGIKPGLALNPEVELRTVYDLLPHIDYLLVLSVHPGFGGQKFMSETLAKMEEGHRIREERGLRFDIAVDGGVNLQTAKQIVKTGANVLIAGTAVFGMPDIGGAIRTLLDA